MLQASEAFPLNFGFLGKGSAYDVEPLLEQGRAGRDRAEDPRGLGRDACRYRRVAATRATSSTSRCRSTPTRSTSRASTRTPCAAIGGRTIHTYHSEGAGGGHAPDIIRVAGEANCLPSSTNPTNPYTVNTFDEHLDMVMVCHHLNPARARGRRVRRVADPPRDDRRRGRAARPWCDQRARLGLAGNGPYRRDHRAHLAGRGPHAGRARLAARGRRHSGNDNTRIKRYLAKLTINPARIYGIDHEIGSLEPGKLADIVLWEPKFFGIKPEVVFKGGFPAWSVMGESNASLMTCEPLVYRPQWGAFGSACTGLVGHVHGRRRRSTRASQSAGRPAAPLRGARAARSRLSKATCSTTTRRPQIRVDPESYRVEVDGELCTCEPMAARPPRASVRAQVSDGGAYGSGSAVRSARARRG